MHECARDRAWGSRTRGVVPIPSVLFLGIWVSNMENPELVEAQHQTIICREILERECH
jgi:hypothetical protein